MKHVSLHATACCLITASLLSVLPARAQDAAFPNPLQAGVHQASPTQVLHLSASAQTEVPEDWLVMTLSVQLEGMQASGVQKQLNAVLTSAIASATSALKPGAVELSTGHMNVSPRYGRDGKIQVWTGVAQLLLQGRDAEQIATLATRLEGLSVSSIAWRLSADRKKEAEMQLQAEAVERFQSKAQTLTKQFGFARYTLGEVRIGTQESGEGIMPRMAMAQMDAPSSAMVPTVSGKTRVVLNVAGSIQLR